MWDHVLRRPGTEDIPHHFGELSWRNLPSNLAGMCVVSCRSGSHPSPMLPLLSMAQYCFWLTLGVFTLRHDHPSKLSL